MQVWGLFATPFKSRRDAAAFQTPGYHMMPLAPESRATPVSYSLPMGVNGAALLHAP